MATSPHVYRKGGSNLLHTMVPVRIDAYIPYLKYQVKPHSSPWF